MDQIHELLVASICYPAATFRCSLGSEQNGVLLSMSATAIAALLGAGEEEISAAQITGLIGDQIMAFQQTASHILGDLQAMWSDRDLGLRCLDVVHGAGPDAGRICTGPIRGRHRRSAGHDGRRRVRSHQPRFTRQRPRVHARHRALLQSRRGQGQCTLRWRTRARAQASRYAGSK